MRFILHSRAAQFGSWLSHSFSRSVSLHMCLFVICCSVFLPSSVVGFFISFVAFNLEMCCIKIVISGAKEYTRVVSESSFYLFSSSSMALPPPSSLWPRVLPLLRSSVMFGCCFFFFFFVRFWFSLFQYFCVAAAAVAAVVVAASQFCFFFLFVIKYFASFHLSFVRIARFKPNKMLCFCLFFT